jgi:ribosomal protein S18 acetylase RimI-like enzyme
MKKRTIAQTPAPSNDIIKGSSINKKGSARNENSSKIVLSDTTIKVLQDKLNEFKKKNPNNKNITLNDLKAVYRRGSGAYSTSHRPNITRAGWSYARVNKFLEKAAGNKVKKAYIQDDDLMENGGVIISDNDNNSVTLKYFENNQQIGYLQYYISLDYPMSEYLDKEPYNFKSEIYIDFVEVNKYHRNKGIGKRLLTKAINDAKKLNVDVVSLKRDTGLGCNYGSLEDNYLKNIYVSLGFVETWTEKEVDESGDDKNICSMHLDLRHNNKYEQGGNTKTYWYKGLFKTKYFN